MVTDILLRLPSHIALGSTDKAMQLLTPSNLDSTDEACNVCVIVFIAIIRVADREEGEREIVCNRHHSVVLGGQCHMWSKSKTKIKGRCTLQNKKAGIHIISSKPTSI